MPRSGEANVTTIFHVSGATQQWLHTAMMAMRNDMSIRQVFQMTAAASLVVRGTADQIAAANTWMASHAQEAVSPPAF